ncbi:MAG: SHOCT domain-containing protein [bacterium]|nr:SHOCT domain-containing protein [bacterium]
MARLGCLLMFVAMGAMAALVVLPVLGPFRDNETLMQLQAAINCPPGYTFENEFETFRPRPGETIDSATGYCIAPDGERIMLTEEQTVRFFVIAIAAFVVPFVGGLLLFIFGVNRGVTRSLLKASGGQIPGLAWDSRKGVTVTANGPIDPQQAALIKQYTGIDVADMQVQAAKPGEATVFTMQADTTPPSARFDLAGDDRVTGADADRTLAERLRQLEEARRDGLITETEYDAKRRAIIDGA